MMVAISEETSAPNSDATEDAAPAAPADSAAGVAAATATTSTSTSSSSNPEPFMSPSAVPGDLLKFIETAEMALDHEAKLAVETPNAAALTTSSSTGSLITEETRDEEDDKPVTKPTGATTTEPDSAAATDDSDAAVKAPHSPLLSMKAARNTMLAATDQVQKFIFAEHDDDDDDDATATATAGLHDFDGLYTLQLAAQLQEMYQSKTLCDIAITCGTQKFDFHKVVLSCGSGYFRKLLADDSTQSEHILTFEPAIQPGTFEVVVESLYTGAITKIDYETSIPLLRATYFLDVPHATAQCTEFLLHELDQDKCLAIWKAARFCSNDVLHVASTAMIGDLLSDDRLEVPNEMVVYEAVIAWIKHDTANREGLLAQVLKTVRFPYLSRHYLTKRVAAENLVQSNHDAMHMYSKAMRYKLTWGGFAKEDEPIKRRDHIKYQLQSGFENYRKERREDTRTFEQRIEDMRITFLRMFQEHLLLNKFIVAPLVFCKDQIFVKHLIAPIKESPCIPIKAFEDDDERALKEYFGDETGDDSRNALSAGPVVPHEESFFIKYIARPIEKSPCMPADSDDEEDYRVGDDEEDYRVGDDEEEGGEDGGDTPAKEKPKDRVRLSLLGDSVWTKINPDEKPGKQKFPVVGEEKEQ
jgi:hypothetical protein